jgi:hypothetical protein
MFNLNLETNELLLSSIVNPYQRAVPSTGIAETITFRRNGIEYKHRSISTGDDFPQWWLRLTTDLLLSDSITNQNEEKEKSKLPPPSPRQDQSVQTEPEKSRPTSSSHSSRIPKTSSSTTTSTHYEYIDEIDDGNNAKRILTYSGNNSQGVRLISLFLKISSFFFSLSFRLVLIAVMFNLKILVFIIMEIPIDN